MLSAAVALAAMTACQENVVPETPAGNPETYTVKLACAGELEVNHVPLKSSSDDLYGIQVYYAPVSGGSYQKYAYGLFDDLSATSLELLADYKYKVVVDMIVDGKNALYEKDYLVNEEIHSAYDAPFLTNASASATLVTNEFIIDSSVGFKDLGGYIRLANGVKAQVPRNVDSYYGKLVDYQPTGDGEEITVYMKHMIYGLKVVADEFLSEGTVNCNFSFNNVTWDEDCFTLTPESNVFEAIYTHYDRDVWYDKEQLHDAIGSRVIGISWTKEDGTKYTLAEQRVYIYRMKQTVVNVTFYEDESAGNTKVSMVFDDLEMSENETSYTFGDDQDEYEW